MSHWSWYIQDEHDFLWGFDTRTLKTILCSRKYFFMQVNFIPLSFRIILTSLLYCFSFHDGNIMCDTSLLINKNIHIAWNSHLQLSKKIKHHLMINFFAEIFFTFYVIWLKAKLVGSILNPWYYHGLKGSPVLQHRRPFYRFRQ